MMNVLLQVTLFMTTSSLAPASQSVTRRRSASCLFRLAIHAAGVLALLQLCQLPLPASLPAIALAQLHAKQGKDNRGHEGNDRHQHITAGTFRQKRRTVQTLHRYRAAKAAADLTQNADQTAASRTARAIRSTVRVSYAFPFFALCVPHAP